MRKEEKLIYAMGNINEKFIEEANGKMKKKTRGNPNLKKVVGFIIIIGIALFLFLPINNNRIKLSPYEDSAYYPLIEKIEPYRAEATALPYDNNFELIISLIGAMFKGLIFGGMDYAPTFPEDEMMGAGSQYVETTDNQVAGVIEGDIVKTTMTHLFHLSSDMHLRIFELNGENTKKVAERNVTASLDAISVSEAEMYLTADGTTVIIVVDYTSKNKEAKVGVMTFGVATNSYPVLSSVISIDGDYNTSRLVGDKLLLVSEYYFNPKGVNYDDPSTYVPTVTRNGVDSLLTMDEILAPDEIDASRYSIVAAIDVKNSKIIGANGLLNFTNSVYVSENNVYVTREYTDEAKTDDGKIVTETKTDIAALGYTEGDLERQVITVSGSVLNQYSMDEREGHLRVVTSTNKRIFEHGFASAVELTESASLYVVSLESGETIASVENFAPKGEEVASVRFDGDTLYVCTAVVVTFTDPVFFFDLSDYSNITYTDTGIIEGFSTSLINLGEGFLLGIGREGWQYNKVEVYEEQAGQVVSVAEFAFDGRYSENYKDYFINREENLFGFGVTYDSKYGSSYVLLQFDGYDLNVVSVMEFNNYYGMPTGSRGILRDGYFYLVNDRGVTVLDLSVPYGEEGHIVKDIKAR